MSAHSNNEPDSNASHSLSVVLIAPDRDRRRGLVKAVTGTLASVEREFAEYPPAGELANEASAGFDVIVVDLDADVERALGLIESVCSINVRVTVMACSGRGEADLPIRAMRAGAREFLTEPIVTATIAEAFARASARRETRVRGKVPGKLLVFTGAKGGVGTTTLSTNFAVALARETTGKVVLVDLHPQLGEVAIGLGLQHQFSIVDALKNASRLDVDFLSTLLTKHSSGLAVLASADEYGASNLPLDQGAQKLLRILREEFAFVVVDAGACACATQGIFMDAADNIYLVTEVNLPGLRNANRMLAFFSGKEGPPKVEIVLNRFNSRKVEIDEESTAKALKRPVDWKIPNDYMAVRRAQNVGTPFVLRDLPISRTIGQMAKAACGKSGNILMAAQSDKVLAGKEGDKWKFWTSNNSKPLCIEP